MKQQSNFHNTIDGLNLFLRTQGIRDTEKLLLQNQLKETQSELAKLNNKYYELTKDLERTRYMLEDVSGKTSKVLKLVYFF